MKGMIVLSHGLESGPMATKVSALAQVAEEFGWQHVRPDYRGIDAPRQMRGIDQRIAMALEAAEGHSRVVFAGSSMGAFTSGLASMQRACEGLFLLALPMRVGERDFAAAAVPATLVHGWDDDICPVEPVIDFARGRDDTLHLVADGHRLEEHVQLCNHAFAHFLRELG